MSIPQGFKPTLAAHAVGYPGPGMVSPKIDGVRCFIFDGVAYGRSGKPFKNQAVQEWARREADSLNHCDGELAFGELNDPLLCSKTTGFLNRTRDESPFKFVVFDIYDPHLDYQNRLAYLWSEHPHWPANVSVIETYGIDEEREWNEMGVLFTSLGYEGMMWRAFDAPYLCGRSTDGTGRKAPVLLKDKPFTDHDAFIYGYEEAQHNDNEATTGALGQTERRSLAEHRRPAGRVGKLLAVDLETGVEFKIGIFRGVTHERLAAWFRDPASIPKFVKYRKMAHGEKDKPRHSTFLTERVAEDIETIPVWCTSTPRHGRKLNR